MKILSDKSVKISRAILFVVTTLCIPFIIASFILEPAFGGAEFMKFFAGPSTLILILFIYTLYKRWSDKRKNLYSKKHFIVIELIIGLILFLIASLTMYAMVTADFEVDVFLILFGLIYVSLITSLGCIRDLKTST